MSGPSLDKTLDNFKKITHDLSEVTKREVRKLNTQSRQKEAIPYSLEDLSEMALRQARIVQIYIEAAPFFEVKLLNEAIERLRDLAWQSTDLVGERREAFFEGLDILKGVVLSDTPPPSSLSPQGTLL